MRNIKPFHYLATATALGSLILTGCLSSGGSSSSTIGLDGPAGDTADLTGEDAREAAEAVLRRMIIANGLVSDDSLLFLTEEFVAGIAEDDDPELEVMINAGGGPCGRSGSFTAEILEAEELQGPVGPETYDLVQLSASNCLSWEEEDESDQRINGLLAFGIRDYEDDIDNFVNFLSKDEVVIVAGSSPSSRLEIRDRDLLEDEVELTRVFAEMFSAVDGNEVTYDTVFHFATEFRHGGSKVWEQTVNLLGADGDDFAKVIDDTGDFIAGSKGRIQIAAQRTGADGCTAPGEFSFEVTEDIEYDVDHIPDDTGTMVIKAGDTEATVEVTPENGTPSEFTVAFASGPFALQNEVFTEAEFSDLKDEVEVTCLGEDE